MFQLIVFHWKFLEKFPEFLLAILPIPEKIMEIFPSFRKQWLETSLLSFLVKTNIFHMRKNFLLEEN
jgi:hypothetical protein